MSLRKPRDNTDNSRIGEKMADTLQPVNLPDGAWVDIYSATNINKGVQIESINIGSTVVSFHYGETAPIGEYGAVPVRPWSSEKNNSGDTGAWCMSSGGDGLILVKESPEYPNGKQQALVLKSVFKDGIETEANRNQAVDGSVTPVRFKQGPPPGEVWQFTRMLFAIRDGGSFDSGGWGNRTSPLDNGVTAGVFINNTERNLTPIPWKSHFDLAAISYDVDPQSFGQGDEYVVMRLTFTKAGQNIRLNGDNGDYVWIDINDDLEYLVEQRAMMQGFIENVYW